MGIVDPVPSENLDELGLYELIYLIRRYWKRFTTASVLITIAIVIADFVFFPVKNANIHALKSVEAAHFDNVLVLKIKNSFALENYRRQTLDYDKLQVFMPLLFGIQDEVGAFYKIKIKGSDYLFWETNNASLVKQKISDFRLHIKDTLKRAAYFQSLDFYRNLAEIEVDYFKILASKKMENNGGALTFPRLHFLPNRIETAKSDLDTFADLEFFFADLTYTLERLGLLVGGEKTTTLQHRRKTLSDQYNLASRNLVQLFTGLSRYLDLIFTSREMNIPSLKWALLNQAKIDEFFTPIDSPNEFEELKPSAKQALVKERDLYVKNSVKKGLKIGLVSLFASFFAATFLTLFVCRFNEFIGKQSRETDSSH